MGESTILSLSWLQLERLSILNSKAGNKLSQLNAFVLLAWTNSIKVDGFPCWSHCYSALDYNHAVLCSYWVIDLSTMTHIKVLVSFQSFYSVDNFCQLQVSPNKLIPARFGFWGATSVHWYTRGLAIDPLFVSQTKSYISWYTQWYDMNFSPAILNFIVLRRSWVPHWLENCSLN